MNKADDELAISSKFQVDFNIVQAQTGQQECQVYEETPLFDGVSGCFKVAPTTKCKRTHIT